MDEGTAEEIVSDALRGPPRRVRADPDRRLGTLRRRGQLRLGARRADASVGVHYALLLSTSAGMAFFVAASRPDDALPRSRVVLDLALHPLRRRGGAPAVTRGGPEVPDRRGFGSAILLFGRIRLRGDGLPRPRGDRRGRRRADRLFLVAGLALIIVGLAFKTSARALPHVDARRLPGAPTPVTAFMSAATKVAASSS